MLTAPGTCAAALPLDRATAAPPLGAGPFRVTVPVDRCPPVTEDGFKPRLVTLRVTGGGALTVAPPHPHRVRWVVTSSSWGQTRLCLDMRTPRGWGGWRTPHFILYRCRSQMAGCSPPRRSVR